MPKPSQLRDYENPFEAVAFALINHHTRYAPEVLDIQGTRAHVKAIVGTIFSQHERLNFLLDNYGDMICTRWQHKAPAAREKVITAAWPRILPRSHRPDVEGLRRYDLEKPLRPEQDLFLFPHLNLDDLSKPRPLMVMMHSRARHSPEAFAVLDNESMWLGRVSATLIPGTLGQQTMFLKGETTANTYGRIVQWRNDNKIKQCQDEGIGLSPGKGLQVLQFQQQLFNFLVECAELILPDIKHQQPRRDSEAAKHSSITTFATQTPSKPLEILLDAPYRAPPPIDLGNLAALLRARNMEAVEHLWFLRQDPGYFRDAIDELSQHQREHLCDANQESHPALGTQPFWRRVVADVMGDGLDYHYLWSLMCSRLEIVISLYEKHKKDMGPGKCLHPAFDKALTDLYDQATRLRVGCITWIADGLASSPAFRQLYRRKAKGDLETIETVKSKKARNNTLLWILERMGHRDKMRFFGLHTLLSFVDRLMLSDPKERQQVPGWICKQLSDLALVDRIEQLDRLIRFGREKHTTMSDEIRHRERQKELNSFRLIMRMNAVETRQENCTFDDPVARFMYPCDEPRTQATTEQMHDAEIRLDEVWESLDDVVRKHDSSGNTPDSFSATILKVRPLERTAVWTTDNAEVTAESFGEFIKDSEAWKVMEKLRLCLDNVSVILSELRQTTPVRDLLDSSHQAEHSQAPSLVESSTRASPTQTSSTDGLSLATKAAESQVEDERAARKALEDSRLNGTYALSVSKKVYRVFSILFPLPKYGGHLDESVEPNTPAHLLWADFVHAMNSVDMMAERLCGSAWVFTPKEYGETEKQEKHERILFYEPREGKIKAMEARRWGMRLTWMYGWKRGTFESLDPPLLHRRDDVDPSTLYKEHNISVPIDYFHNDTKYEPHLNGTFPLRYWFDASYYKDGGPVIVLQSGETDGIGRLPFLQKGIVHKLAQATNGIGVILEHRYYGKSFPTPDLSTANLRFLTTDQALADMAYFAQNVVFEGLEDKCLTAPTTAYFGYGGSYAGAFVAFLRVLYPEVYYGAISSSGVTEAIWDFWRYYEPVRKYGPPDCIDKQTKLINVVDNILLNNTKYTAQLKSAFGMESITYDDDFAQVLSYPIGGWQGRNWDPEINDPSFYEYCSNITSPTLISNTTTTPNITTLAQTLLLAAGYTNNSTSTLTLPLLNFIHYIQSNYIAPILATNTTLNTAYSTHNQTFYAQSSLSQSSWRSWPYQYCTQWGYLQTGSGVPASAGLPLVSRLLTLGYNSLICRYAFNITTPPDVEAINKYGGYNISYDRLAIIDGEEDPWREASPHSTVAPNPNRTSTTERPFLLIEGAVHHWDENGRFANETTAMLPPAPVKDIQADEVMFVKAWMEEFRTAKREEL
ncbi:MAG: hypothetical protein Q9212_006153 [Teloschistes hypoglaucus]